MNRTEDGRFSEDRAVFESTNIGSVIDEVKDKQGWTWEEFADRFGVSAYTVRQSWRNEADSIPFSVADKLLELSDRDVSVSSKSAWHGQRKGGSRSNLRGKVPEQMSVEVAELYGALLGDGCLYSNLNGFCITGNMDLDQQYIKYLQELSVSLFGTEPNIHFQEEESVVRLILNSRKVAAYLKDKNFPVGEKKEQEIRVLGKLREGEYLKAVIRGLFDTDGGIYAHPNSGIMMDITAKNTSLLDFLDESAAKLDLPLNRTHDRVQLYGEEKLDKFMNMIGSSNSRNIKRYLHYKRNAKVPPADSSTLLKSRSNDFDVPYHGFVV